MAGLIEHHILMRDEDGWTWLYASSNDSKMIQQSLAQNTRGYPSRKFVYLHEPGGFHEAQQRVQRINLKNKGDRFSPQYHKEQKALNKDKASES